MNFKCLNMILERIFCFKELCERPESTSKPCLKAGIQCWDPHGGGSQGAGGRPNLPGAPLSATSSTCFQHVYNMSSLLTSLYTCIQIYFFLNKIINIYLKMFPPTSTFARGHNVGFWGVLCLHRDADDGHDAAGLKLFMVVLIGWCW